MSKLTVARKLVAGSMLVLLPHMVSAQTLLTQKFQQVNQEFVSAGYKNMRGEVGNGVIYQNRVSMGEKTYDFKSPLFTTQQYNLFMKKSAIYLLEKTPSNDSIATDVNAKTDILIVTMDSLAVPRQVFLHSDSILTGKTTGVMGRFEPLVDSWNVSDAFCSPGNPSVNFTVTSNKNQAISMQIVNVLGQSIESKTIQAVPGTTNINIGNNLSTGAYFTIFYNEAGAIAKKFLRIK